MKHTLSIVVPCYNEEKVVRIFYEAVNEAMRELKDVELEFVFVDDGSRDGTLGVMQKLHAKDKRVHFVSFSRNFGKEGALLAGLEHATGDFVVTMDVDLQDPPSMLPEMYQYVASGEYDSVGTRRVNRIGEPPIRSFFARMFYRIINRMSRLEMVDGARDFRLMSRQVVDAVLSLREYSRYSKGIYSFVGFKTKWLEFENVKRVAGETHWSFWKLFFYALDGICAFSTVPLAFPAVAGIICGLVSFGFLIAIIVSCIASGAAAAWMCGGR